MPVPSAEDYYALLGVPADAGAEALRRAWREQAARWHPDRAGPGAAERFQRISAAYAVLSDPLARLAYDRARRASCVTTTSPAAAPRPGAAPRRAAPAVMLSRLSRPLHVLLACGTATFDEPGHVTLMLREDEAAQGGMAMIAMRVDLWCPDCGGRTPAADCRRCGGRRTVDELFSAWLAFPPGVTSGEVLAPSVDLPNMVEPVRFRIRVAGAA